MGHLTLISEEIVKLFYDYPTIILAEIPKSAFDRQRWEAYVEGHLRETRERDLQRLGGAVSVKMNPSVSNGSGGIGVLETDDEFPGQAGRTLFSADQVSEGSDANPEKAHVRNELHHIADHFSEFRLAVCKVYAGAHVCRLLRLQSPGPISGIV